MQTTRITGLFVLLLLPLGAASEACHFSAGGTLELVDASVVDGASPDTLVADGSLLDSWRPDGYVRDAYVQDIENADVGINSDIPMVALDAASNADVNSLDVGVTSDAASNADVTSSDGEVALDASSNADVTVSSDGTVASDISFNADVTVSSNPVVWLPTLTSALESAQSLELCVHRSANLDRAETVQISTKQLDLGNGVGVHPAAGIDTDYIGFFDTLIFSIGESSACFHLSIIDNALPEGDAELGLGIVSAEFSEIAPGQNWNDDLANGLPRIRLIEDDTVCSGNCDGGVGDADSWDTASNTAVLAAIAFDRGNLSAEVGRYSYSAEAQSLLAPGYAGSAGAVRCLIDGHGFSPYAHTLHFANKAQTIYIRVYERLSSGTRFGQIRNKHIKIRANEYSNSPCYWNLTFHDDRVSFGNGTCQRDTQQVAIYAGGQTAGIGALANNPNFQAVATHPTYIWPSNTWFRWEIMIKANDLDQDNGEIKIWFDNNDNEANPDVHFRGLNLRDASMDWYLDRLELDSYSDQNRWPGESVNSDWDEIVVSKRFVGR